MIEDKTCMTDQQVDEELSGLEGWYRDGRFLKKEFVFANFREINQFLPYLTKTIVDQNHHPDFAFISGQKKVKIEVTTHSEGGLTKSDINLAEALNQWRDAKASDD